MKRSVLKSSKNATLFVDAAYGCPPANQDDKISALSVMVPLWISRNCVWKSTSLRQTRVHIFDMLRRLGLLNQILYGSINHSEEQKK